MAQIQLPIAITETGSYELLAERIRIQFQPLVFEELPEIQSIENQALLHQMLSMVRSTEKDSENKNLEKENPEKDSENKNPEKEFENKNPEKDSENKNPEKDSENKNLEKDSENKNAFEDVIKIYRNDYLNKTPKKRNNISFRNKYPSSKWTRRNYDS